MAPAVSALDKLMVTGSVSLGFGVAVCPATSCPPWVQDEQLPFRWLSIFLVVNMGVMTLHRLMLTPKTALLCVHVFSKFKAEMAKALQGSGCVQERPSGTQAILARKPAGWLHRLILVPSLLIWTRLSLLGPHFSPPWVLPAKMFYNSGSSPPPKLSFPAPLGK